MGACLPNRWGLADGELAYDGGSYDLLSQQVATLVQRVQLRRSTTPGSVPSSLLVGELAANLADRQIYLGLADGSAVPLLGQQNGSVSVVCQPGVDAAPAINAALASTASVVLLPAGTWTVGSTISVPAYKTLAGMGKARTILLNSTANQPTLAIAAYAQYAAVRGLWLGRAQGVTALAGGDGLTTLGDLHDCEISDVISAGNFNGFTLTSADRGVLRDFYAVSNVQHGVYHTNTSDSGVCQWSIYDGQSLSNGNCGYLAQSQAMTTSPPNQMIVGDIRGVQTYGNGGYGAAFLGSSGVPIQDVRVASCFFGTDTQSEVYLDTYGRMHSLADVFTELSVQGGGIVISPNNATVRLVGCNADSNHLAGFQSAAASTVITGGSVTNNGLGNVAAANMGILLNNPAGLAGAGARLIVQASALSGNTGFAVYAQVGNTLCVIGCDFTGSTSALGAASGGAFITTAANLPGSMNTLLQGPLAVGGAAAISSGGNGAVNAAGGIYSNGVQLAVP